MKLGKTPLHYAVELENSRLTSLMMSWDASPLIKDNSGRTALDLASTRDIQRALVEPPKTQESPSTILTSPNVAPSFAEEMQTSEESDLLSNPHDQGAHIFDKHNGDDPNLWDLDHAWEPRAEEPNQSDISFGTKRESNPVLLSWLSSIKLEAIYDTLL
jgi:hypothetical protein